MTERSSSRFESIEEAHEYIGLLREVVAEAQIFMLQETSESAGDGDARYLAAMRLVTFKLDKLDQHLAASSRILNDLRTLRRAIYGERPDQRASDIVDLTDSNQALVEQ